MNPHTDSITTRVAPGALVRVLLNSESHLLVVRRSLASHLIVSPLHPYREWAAHGDVIVEPDAGHPYPVIVHLGMEGCIEHGAVDGVVGHLAPDWEQGSRGWPIHGPLDARWEFLDRQRQWFMDVCAPCTARLLFSEL